MRIRTGDYEEWNRRYTPLRDAAIRCSRKSTEEARGLCIEAGLDGELLGIHPGNAMNGFDTGRPWPGIDYGKVRRCLFVLRTRYMPDRVVAAWERIAFG